jgi:hypothetical protein
MNYKIHMAFARNSEERYGAVIGSELWHEGSVFRFVDYRALALIMQTLQGVRNTINDHAIARN